jgi:hypothetical protein
MEIWLESLKNNMMAFHFKNTSHRFYIEAFDWFDRFLDDRDRLEFIIRLQDIDHGILHMIMYQTKEWKHKLIIDLYNKLSEITQTKRIRRIAISYLISHHHVTQDMIQFLFDRVLEDDDWESFDILHQHSYLLNAFQRERMYQWMHENRFLQDIFNQVHPIPLQSIQILSVYEDQQNVHHKEINDSVWKNINILKEEFQLFPITEEDLQKLLASMKTLNHSQSNSLQRIRNDRNLFTRNDTQIYLKDVLFYIYSFILRQSQDLQQELIQRLEEELEDMSGTCTSGHLSRLVNCLVGYHPKINIEISEYDRVKAVFSNMLQKLIKEDNDQEIIILDMMNPSPDNAFIQFIKKQRKKIIQDISIHLEIEMIKIQELLTDIWKDVYPNHENIFIKN